MGFLFILLALLFAFLFVKTWKKKEVPNRLQNLRIYGALCVLLFAGVWIAPTSLNFGTGGSTSPTTSQSAQVSTTTDAGASSGQRTATSSAESERCATAAAATFSKVLALYTSAYQDGQDSLGTTQYADANAGLQALTIPGSAASNFSGWQKTWRTFEPKFYNSIVQSYGAASDCYFQLGVAEPTSLANGRDDMAQLDGDIFKWIPDAVAWQIQTASTAKLSNDETVIVTDIGVVQQDITALKSND